jgi:hypothetical protein
VQRQPDVLLRLLRLLLLACPPLLLHLLLGLQGLRSWAQHL